MSDPKIIEYDDKELIKIEEKEKMLNEENIKDSGFDAADDVVKESFKGVTMELTKTRIKTGEVEKMKKQLEESQKEEGKGIRVPIGGIKIPGFLKSRIRDKNKETEPAVEEADIEPPCIAQNVRKEESKEPEAQTQHMAQRLKKIIIRIPRPGRNGEPCDRQEVQEEAKDGNQKKQNLIDSIKIPLISVLPRKFTKESKEQKNDAEMGTAGLASMETLEDSKESNGLAEDGMETVKLDMDDSKDVETQELAAKRKQALFNKWNFRDWKNWPEKFMTLNKHEKAIVLAITLFLMLLLLIIIIIMIIVCKSDPFKSLQIDDYSPLVHTSCGFVEGILENETYKFLGVPYAVPPVGAKRWQYAEPLNELDKCWKGTFKAHNSNSTCWQLYMERNEKWRIDGAEDCLTLDIITPRRHLFPYLPVVVLIDAATLVGGSPGILKPNPAMVHNTDVIFVRPNFRLGVFGFLATDVLSKATHPPRSGNYGLSDIITALKWIKTNIRYFGGNENNISLVGHRAGATLVTALAFTDSAKKLFNRAWASSGSVLFPQTVLQLSEQANQRYIDHICSKKPDKLNCLLTHDAEELIEEIEDAWRPMVSDLPTIKEVNATKHDWLVLDGDILKEDLWQEAAAHVPLVIGTTAHSEASPQLWEKLQNLYGTTDEAILRHIKESYLGVLGIADEALNLYNNTWKGLAAMVSDIRTVCPLYSFANSQQNISFYIVTQERNHTDFGQIADINVDMAAIMGNYEPSTEAQNDFVSTILSFFYSYVSKGKWQLEKQNGILVFDQSNKWQDYPKCSFWISKNIVPQFARRD